MERSEQINELAKALSNAQAEFTNVFKSNTAKIVTKSGASYSYSYADLAELLDMVREPLSQNGLALMQSANTEEDIRVIDNKPVIVYKLLITTFLIHVSGQWIKNELRLPVVDTGNNIIQAIGSSITYGRRYEVSSILGIASEKDDDANAATPAKSATTTQKQTEKPPIQEPKPRDTKATGDDKFKEGMKRNFDVAKRSLNELTGSDKEYYRIIGEAGVEGWNELPTVQMAAVFKKLNARYKELAKDLGKEKK